MARSRGLPRAAGFRELTSAEAVRVGSLQAGVLYPPSVRALLRARRPRHFNWKADLVAASQYRGKVALESRYTVTNCYSSGMICDSSVRNWRDTVANLDLTGAAPTAANVTVKAPRDYLTEREVEKLMDAARENRWGHRDATAILPAYRHGLRASELVGLRWDDIDWQTSTLHVPLAVARRQRS
jgi:integrase